MSRDWHEKLRSCVSKKRYLSFVAASEAVSTVEQLGEFGMNAYWCANCSHWHIGHLPKKIYRGGNRSINAFRMRRR